ncbi:MAG: DUF4129 domain-containing protein [Pseudomonadota bacterium]
MKLESLSVELRPRSSWEAMELGAALVRRHARTIWLSWLIVVGTVFVAVNLAAWAIGQVWLAWLAMWWLRPVFDRIPLYVLSRAVFGAAPGVAETVRAQLSWGWRPMLGHLTWRRFSPWRAAMLPVDLLEGADPSRLPERRRVIGGGVSGPSVLLTTACLHFLAALQLSIVMLALLFVPNELLPEAARAAWASIETDPPDWALVAFNAVDWLAVAFIEPFFVGAGFGLYLNRRTQLEAWDLEIVFRRMRRRLASAGLSTAAGALLAPVLLAFALLASPIASAQEPPAGDNRKQETPAADGPAQKASSGDAKSAAQAAAEAVADAEHAGADDAPQLETRTLQEIFGEDAVSHEAFGKAVGKAYKDPMLRPKQETTTWQPRDRDKKKEEEEDEKEFDSPILKWLANAIAFVVENLLWLLLGALALALALTARKWWPWLRGVATLPPPEPAPVDSVPLADAEPLPPDIATVARRLWREGQPRRALALLYRASVEAMTARVGAHPPPGATEADCLRLSRRLPEVEDREAFQRVVRVWQYAAYGHTLPEADAFETLVSTLAQRFRWAA